MPTLYMTHTQEGVPFTEKQQEAVRLLREGFKLACEENLLINIGGFSFNEGEGILRMNSLLVDNEWDADEECTRVDVLPTQDETKKIAGELYEREEKFCITIIRDEEQILKKLLDQNIKFWREVRQYFHKQKL